MTKTLLPLLLFLASCSQVQEKHSDIIRHPTSFKSTFDLIQEKISRAEYGPKDEDRKGLKRALSLEAFSRVFGNQNLMDVHYEKTSEHILQHNQLVVDMLTLEPETSLSGIPYVTLEEAKKVYQSIIDSSVVVNKSAYDPNGNEGYCFGRAIIGHVEAIAHGLDPRAVKKIWTVGNWSHYPFHVAILLKGKEGWYAIDRAYLGVVSAQEWIERSIPSEISGDRPNMIFVTDGDRFSLQNALTYRSVDFFSTDNEFYEREGDFYRGYFKDFFEELEKKQITPFVTKNLESKSPNIFIQYEIVKKMQKLYPHVISFDEWEKVYQELDVYLQKNESELMKMTDVRRVLKYRSMLLDVATKLHRPLEQLEKDVDHAETLVELSNHLESLYGSANPDVKKTMGKLFQLPIGEVDRYLKRLLSLQINRKLSYELVEHFIGGGILDKSNPYFQEIVDLILKKDYFDEKTQEIVKKNLHPQKTQDCFKLISPLINSH
ncbi:MAG: hypothetical protein KBD76_06365 [Bacteriovorax sp.]|nr:hypothetical protein [Bacteriovorax sp.]